MKAEEILNNNGLSGKLKCRNLELNEIDREDIVECMQEYARIQIEKDRSETKRLMNEKLKDFEGMNPEIEAIIDREITLN
jgi:hypothetical protein